MLPGGDPPDFIVDSRGVEVVELLQPGRKRGKQYRAKLEAAERGSALSRRMISRRAVVEHGHEWVLNAIDEKVAKYDQGVSAQWTLLIYVNVPWADCLSWGEVDVGLVALSPPFAGIEAVFDLGTGPVSATLWRRPA